MITLMCVHSIVNIIKPPESITVCSGSDVKVHCGYMWSTQLSVTWIINGTMFDRLAIQDSPLYRLNNPGTPISVSLTVFSINATTTFQCMVHSTPNTTTSRRGTVTVTTGMYVHIIMHRYVRMQVCTRIHKVQMQVAIFLINTVRTSNK